MSATAAPRRFPAAARGVDLAVASSYAVLGTILVATRLEGLDRSYWHDEIVTVTDFVRAGPREILTGPYLPNNHELFSILAWATSSVVSESETSLRLWAVLPFLVGVMLVTGWLHVRLGSQSALLFLLLATASPLLLDISRQARGYGLAFLAMAIVTVSALEADRARSSWSVPAMCLGGVVGSLTLPHFSVAFIATGLVLLRDPQLRRQVAAGLLISLLLIAAWYSPHALDLEARAHQHFGVQVPWYGVITAPLDQVLIPAMLWLEGLTASASLVWLPLTIALAVIALSSPLVRDRRAPLLLAAPLVTVLIAWAGRLYLAPRYVSFLLVPLFVLLATGLSATLVPKAKSRLDVRPLISVAVLALIVFQFLSTAPGVLRHAREAHKNVAAALDRTAPPGTVVVAHMHQPGDLAFYLQAPVTVTDAAHVARDVCRRHRPVALVNQSYAVDDLAVPCLRRPGTRSYRFEQYARGGGIDLWLIPPVTDRRRGA